MKFLYNAPAILHKGAIIVGDTHFGMEEKLRKKGIHDQAFSLKLFERLDALIKKHNAKKVIFLGDVKEEITALDPKTFEVLSRLSKKCSITVVRGNHDGGIERMAGIEVAPPEGIVYEGLGLVHGHSWPGEKIMQCKYLIAGHQHPMVSITDAFGRKHTEAAWILATGNNENLKKKYKEFNKKIKLILIPAFNPLVGMIINYDEKKHFGPILNNKLFKLHRALVFRLDGTCLGKLENIF